MSTNRQEGSLDAFSPWLLEQLEWMSDLVSELQAAQLDHDYVADILARAKPLCMELCGCDSAAFVLLDEDGLGWKVILASSPDTVGLMADEVQAQIEAGVFARVVSHHRPSFMRAEHVGTTVFLHPLTSPSSTLGIFVGIYEEPSPFVPVVAQRLLTILLAQAATLIDHRRLREEIDGDG